jgi:hypothetical protein
MKLTDATPSGFNAVPPHLEAINFLQHLEKFTTNRRARHTHQTSKSRHKFKQLIDDLDEWKKTPTAH